MMEHIISLPVLLAIALFIGIVVLVKILLSPESSLERRSRHDRRRGGGMPTTPFYDVDDQLVTADRRSAGRDRRRRVFAISSDQRRA
ncbi:MAG: hypothetical protein PVG20_07480 [Thioalkalispiraceae bacterium]|jgi:hypothetical protein